MLYKNHIYIFILKFIQYHFFENQFLLKTVKVHTIFIHLKNNKIFEIVTVVKEDNMQKWSYIDWKSWIPAASRSWETWKVNPAWYDPLVYLPVHSLFVLFKSNSRRLWTFLSRNSILYNAIYIPSPRLERSQVMRNLRVLDQYFDQYWIETLIMSLLRQS